LQHFSQKRSAKGVSSSSSVASGRQENGGDNTFLPVRSSSYAFWVKECRNVLSAAHGHILFACLPFVFIYLDDNLVASRSVAEHQRHLSDVFTILQANGLLVNRAKCMFGVASVDFLGHRIAADGIVPLPERVQVVQDFPPLHNMWLASIFGHG
jgi:hypothetical protein